MATSIKEIERKIEVVKTLAAQANITTATYGGGTFESIWLRQENGTCWLSAKVGDGATDLGSARGRKEVDTYLAGMIDTLSAVARFNR